MSKFQVEAKTISQVINHPNADRLTIYQVNDNAYQFISNVKYQVGALVVYFPIDSVMPPELIELFELGTMLAGKEHNRIKTVKLRGWYSQGFIADADTVAKYLNVPSSQLHLIDLTEKLGVVKYDPPPVPCQNGDLVSLPAGNSMYDIEGCDNYPSVIQYIIDNKIPVVITEKLEGQNFSVTVNKSGEVYVSQRRFSIKEKEGGTHDMWEVARREKIIELAKMFLGTDNDSVTLYGEHLGPGIQGNYYGLKERTVRFFDLKVNGKWEDSIEFIRMLACHHANERIAPILAENVLLDEWLDGNTISDASHGKSVLNPDKLREGIVIRPTTEMDGPNGIGRLIIKQRDKIYLGETDF